MTKNTNVRTNGQKIKSRYGDWITLGEMLGCTPDAAKKRYLRGNQEALDAVSAIIESRKNLIENFKNK